MTSEKLYLREAVIVEGRYDRMKLSEFIGSPVIETGGFRVFNDAERRALIRSVAEQRGILIMTDVDGAGFVIRSYLSGIVPPDRVKHCYIPTVLGTEKRKNAPSKEGLLGVEGLSADVLADAIERSGATVIGRATRPESEITKQDFYTLLLSGREGSAELRQRVLRDLGLPKYLSANAMLSAVNCLFTLPEFTEYMHNFPPVG